MRLIRRSGILVAAAALTALSAGPAAAAAATASAPMIHELGTLPGYVAAEATAVNNFGVAVGYATDANFDTTAVKWTYSGAATNLGTLPGDDFSEALGINDLGQVVGYSGNELAGTDHAVEWNAQGAIKDLGAAPGQLSSSEGHAINDLGEVVGDDQSGPRTVTAARWPANGTIDNFGLADFDAIGDTSASAVNDLGEIAGFQFVIHGRPSPIRWYADGSYLLLPVLPNARGGGGQANCINNFGITVGMSPTYTFHLFDAVSWDAEGDITDLGALPDLPGGSEGEALAISDTGFIVGDDFDANGDQVAVLWR